MKRFALTICATSILLFSCNSEKKTDDATKETTEVAKTDEPWVVVDSATSMAKMMEYGTPGPMHQLLASWNGAWNGETTMWDYEGAEPKKSAGKAENTMIMGGKYQSSKHTGDMMGMPFEGMTIMGYDNATKKFTSSWIDTWSTGIMNFSGTWDEASKTLTMTGNYPDILRPGKTCTMKEVMKVIDENTHHMEMYGPDPKTGKEYKMFEMHMTRAK